MAIKYTKPIDREAVLAHLQTYTERHPKHQTYIVDGQRSTIDAVLRNIDDCCSITIGSIVSLVSY